VKESIVRELVPARKHPRVEAPPRLMVFFRIQLVRLVDEEVTMLAGLFNERGSGCGESLRQSNGFHQLRHAIALYQLYAPQ
jgi:hypothetical protein